MTFVLKKKVLFSLTVSCNVTLKETPLAFCLSDMLPSEFYVGSRVLINFYKHISQLAWANY